MPQRILLILTMLVVGVLSSQLRAQPEAQGFLGVKLDNHYVTDGTLVVKITEVIGDSPAEKAGFKRGDVIVNVANVEAKEREIVVDTIRTFKPGDRITIVVIRGEKELDLSATLVRREEP